MIELPEAHVLSAQINEVLSGKTVRSAAANTHPHSFAWYTGDPAAYNGKLAGRTVTSSNPGTGYTCGGNIEILCGDTLLVISTPIKYHAPGDKLPAKHQLLLEFTDGSHMSCTVQMWGSMMCFPADAPEFPDWFTFKRCPDPLGGAFDKTYFDALWDGAKPSLSVKAFLATEQRVPGLGNGVLQDILFHAGLHPKRKLETLYGGDRDKLFRSVKDTLRDMRDGGGRDTEKDLFGNPGGYRTILSAKTQAYACPACGGGITRKAYMGGNVYFCETCQPVRK